MKVDIAKLKMPGISEAGLQALELLANDGIDFDYLARYIGKDPLIAGTMLRYANSPLHRRAAEITNVTLAISLLGFKTCRAAVSYAIMKSYCEPPTRLTERIWSHSVSVATAAKIIADKLFPQLADDIETSALMHDMGALVLARNFPEKYQALLDQCLKDNVPMVNAEQEAFGLTHDDLFPHVAKMLRLPDLIIRAVGNFHAPNTMLSLTDDSQRHRAVVQLAHHFAARYDKIKQFPEHISTELETVSLLLGLSVDETENLYEDCELMLDVL
jgi:HD-like signal output (HDOD) protein